MWFAARVLLLGSMVLGGCARVSDGGGGNPSGTGGARAGTGGSSGAHDGGLDVIYGDPGPGDDAGVCQQELKALIRDFRSGEKDGVPKHPDFESSVNIDPGIVADELGADGKPIYAGGTKSTTTTKANFDQWYRDVVGVNIPFVKSIPLTLDPTRPGVFVYDNDLFYPLGNDEGFGNQYLEHNQDFTTEIHVDFPYKGGEVFTFRGDDDVFIFVAGHLVMDLGGVHDPLTGTVDMDEWAPKLGLRLGDVYRMDIFHAERHCCNSRFHLETTLSCIVNVIVG